MDQQIAERAATGAGYLALGFVSQPETWPVFTAWLKTTASVPLLADRDDAVRLVEVLMHRMLRESAP